MDTPNDREVLGALGKPVTSGEIWHAFAGAIRSAGEVVTAPPRAEFTDGRSARWKACAGKVAPET
jgi:hypothetical protein